MANVKLLFSGSENSGSEEHTATCYANTSNEIYLEIDMPSFETSWICIDKSTAIKLHRELKKHISYLKDE